MKEINILGVSVKERSLKESLKLTDTFLNNGALNTVLYVSSKLLLAAGRDPELKGWIESMDLTVYAEPDILRAAKVATSRRVREIENTSYMREVVHKLHKNKKTVYLLTEKEEELLALEEHLKKLGPPLQIAAENSLEAMGVDMDNLVNHMNDVAANVIISMVSFPLQEKLMAENKRFINAEVWFALLRPDERYDNVEHLNVFQKLFQKVYFFLFRKRVGKYNDQK